MTRLDELQAMQRFIGLEIETELGNQAKTIRRDPLLVGACALYEVSVDDLLLGDRAHRVTRVRHAVAWLMRRRGDTCPLIARHLGLSPSQVHNALTRVDRDPAMKALLLGIEVAS